VEGIGEVSRGKGENGSFFGLLILGELQKKEAVGLKESRERIQTGGGGISAVCREKNRRRRRKTLA